LGSIKGGEFLDQLSDYQLVKKDSALWILLCVLNCTSYIAVNMGIIANGKVVGIWKEAVVTLGTEEKQETRAENRI
jgi:hypothetical protein